MKLLTQVDGGKSASWSRHAEPERSVLRRGVAREIEMRFAASLIEMSLPKSGGLFGKGLSGSVARGHLVETLSEAVVQSGAIGIAKAVAAGSSGSGMSTAIVRARG